MRYAVVYVGCQIVEADSKEEAEEAFFEGSRLYEVERPVFAKPSYGNTYGVADELVDYAAEEIDEDFA